MNLKRVSGQRGAVSRLARVAGPIRRCTNVSLQTAIYYKGSCLLHKFSLISFDGGDSASDERE